MVLRTSREKARPALQLHAQIGRHAEKGITEEKESGDVSTDEVQLKQGTEG